MRNVDIHDQSETPGEPQAMHVAWWGALVLGAAVFVALWGLSVRMLAGDLTYARAELITKSLNQAARKGAATSASSLAGNSLRAEAAGLVARAAALNPVSDTAWLTRAKDLAVAGDFAGAENAALHANALLSSVETFNQIGYIGIELPDLKLAEWGFRSALALDPANPEALERMVWLAKLRLNDPALRANRAQNLQAMLDGLRALDHYTLFNPNSAYLWSQYWHERARTSHDPLQYEAGFRAAALAENRGNYCGYKILSKPDEMLPIMNYYLMGARGYPVRDDGTPFPALPPVKPDEIVYPN